MPLEAYAGYLDLRKYGTVPHSGEALLPLLLHPCWGWCSVVCGWSRDAGHSMRSSTLGSCRPGWVTCVRGWARLALHARSPAPGPLALLLFGLGLAWLPAMYQTPAPVPDRAWRRPVPNKSVRDGPPQALAWALSASSCLPRAWTTSAMSSPSPAGLATPPTERSLLAGRRRRRRVGH